MTDHAVDKDATDEPVAGADAGLCEVAAVAPFALIEPEDRRLLPVGVTDAYPLAQVQSGAIVEMLADADPNLHHTITSFRIRDDKPFAAWALEPAVRAVTARHEALRTSIHLTGYSVPLQLVHAEVNPVVHLGDLTGLDDAGLRAALRTFTREQRQTPFDLSTAPLARVSGHVCDDVWWISITGCQAVLEGRSHHWLLMEVLEAYRRIRDGRALSWPPDPAVRYADFIAAEIAGLSDSADREHWRSLVTTYPKLTLPPSWARARTGRGPCAAPGSPCVTWRANCGPPPRRCGPRSRACCWPPTSRS